LLRKLSELIFGKHATQAISQWAPHTSHNQKAYQKRRALIAKEAHIGGTVLGPIPHGHKREFFCLDKHTWVWHETWKDASGMRQQFIVNYELDPTGVLKRVNGGSYTKLTGQELANFNRAVKTYYREVSQQVYGQTAPAL